MAELRDFIFVEIPNSQHFSGVSRVCCSFILLCPSTPSRHNLDIENDINY